MQPMPKLGPATGPMAEKSVNADIDAEPTDSGSFARMLDDKQSPLVANAPDDDGAASKPADVDALELGPESAPALNQDLADANTTPPEEHTEDDEISAGLSATTPTLVSSHAIALANVTAPPMADSVVVDAPVAPRGRRHITQLATGSRDMGGTAVSANASSPSSEPVVLQNGPSYGPPGGNPPPMVVDNSEVSLVAHSSASDDDVLVLWLDRKLAASTSLSDAATGDNVDLIVDLTASGADANADGDGAATSDHRGFQFYGGTADVVDRSGTALFRHLAQRFAAARGRSEMATLRRAVIEPGEGGIDSVATVELDVDGELVTVRVRNTAAGIDVEVDGMTAAELANLRRDLEAELQHNQLDWSGSDTGPGDDSQDRDSNEPPRRSRTAAARRLRHNGLVSIHA